ncbi:MAG TPA: SpoIIE family protein phosphatase [Vicingaceae bacterium]
MKNLTKIIITNIILVIIIVSLIIMTMMLFKLRSTETRLANSLTQKFMVTSEHKLNDFFETVGRAILVEKERKQQTSYLTMSESQIVDCFMPVLKNYPQISSIGIANEKSYEIDLFSDESEVFTRKVDLKINNNVAQFSQWKKEGDSLYTIKSWENPLIKLPSERDWHTNAMKKLYDNEVTWTTPYIFNTNSEIGLTASIGWENDFTNEITILAFDVTLSDLSNFTRDIKSTPNSMTFIVSENLSYLALPDNKNINNDKGALLQSVNEVNIPAVANAFNVWDKNKALLTQTFKFNSDNETWWASIKPFYLNESSIMYIGTVIPKQDLIEISNDTRYYIIGGFVILVILLLFVLYYTLQNKKINILLKRKYGEISKVNKNIEEKSKEIKDSIQYAKRIQSAILTSEDEFNTNLSNSLLVYLPKDIVAGDFYWYKQKDNLVFYAVADCTGHGVPAAMVSVICNHALNTCVNDYELTNPGEILDKAREIITEAFNNHGGTIQDGMDISLCMLDKNDIEKDGFYSSLQWAGANSPLWLIRSFKDNESELFEYKPNKQPVGKTLNPTPFTTNTISLQKEDSLFIFSDGFSDQFGGERGKKFMSKQFKNFLISISKLSMSTQRELILEKFRDWKGDNEQVDDVCVIGVRI